MSKVGQPERVNQDRVIALFSDGLGYRFLGDWTDRAGNRSVDEGLLCAWLRLRGHTHRQISRVLHTLRAEAANPNRSLCQ
jgi:type I restriction enzyme R subunit